MKAIIIAGREGLRLKPMTCTMSKSMVPVGGKPIIEHIVTLLKKYGIRDIAVTLNYRPSGIRYYLGDGRKFGVKIRYFTDEEPLGNAGSVFMCKEYINDTFLVISGDCYTEVNLSDLIKFHTEQKNQCTFAFRENKSDCMILNPEIMDYCKQDVFCDFEKDILPAALKDNKRVLEYKNTGFCLNIGTAKDYLKANIYYASRYGKIHDSVITEESVIINEPVYIGPGVYIGKGSRIGPGAVIGEGTIIGKNVSVSGSVVWEDCFLSSGSSVSSSVLCGGVNLGRNTVVSDSVMGERSVAEAYGYITKGSKIWPDIRLEEESEVSDSVLCDKGDVENSFIESWPEGWRYICKNSLDSVRFGYVYGKMSGTGAVVTLSCCESGFCTGIMHGIISGLMAAGCNIQIMKNSTLPLLRWSVKRGLCDGGIFLDEFGDYCSVSLTDGLGNEPNNDFRNSFMRKFYNLSNAIKNYGDNTAVSEIVNPMQLYENELNSIFSEAYKSPFLGFNYFSQKEKEGIVAEIIAEFYPDCPVFISAASELPARNVCQNEGVSFVICGGLPGDVMMEMEKHMDNEGVMIQYHMLFDELAFELGIAHFRNLGMDFGYHLKKVIPGVYSSERRVRCSNNLKNNLMGYFSALPELRDSVDITDGISVRNKDFTIRIYPENNSCSLKIHVESLNSEFAGEMCDKLENFAEEWIKREKPL